VKRRDFLKMIASGAVYTTLPKALSCAKETTTFVAAPAGSPVKASDQKYNVLFIAVDDLRPKLSCYGDTEVLSPNIDKLASQGVVFSNHYAHVPTCGASR
jgi:hypothetical protein